MLTQHFSRRKLFSHQITKRALNMEICPEVLDALKQGKPVVALESTIISHGMPFPQNLEVAKKLEEAVRSQGAVPATIAIIDGLPRIGLDSRSLNILASHQGEVKKASTRDLAYVCAKKMHAATTVASTMKLAHLAGISVFATGGIGGVHRGAENTMDISADLIELARTPVTVVCAGIKSILDIPKSLEVLETQGVPVLGWQTKSFPSFFTNDSGVPVPGIVDFPKTVAQMMINNQSLRLSSGIVVGVPNPNPADAVLIEEAISSALLEAERHGIKGAATTPFLLSRIEKLTGGKSLESNISLVLNNARIASQIAVEYSKLKIGTVSQPVPELPLPPVLSEGIQENLSSSALPSSNQFESVNNDLFKESDTNSQILASKPAKLIPVSPPSDEYGPTDILIVGGAVMDIVGHVTTGLTHTRSSNPGKLGVSLGGVGRNIADNLALYGLNTSLATAIAFDESGRSILARAKDLELDMSSSKVIDIREQEKPLATARYSAIHDHQGDLVVGIADMDIFKQIDPTHIQSLEAKIQEAKIIVSDGNISIESFAELSKLCKQYNKPLFFEPTSDHKCLLPFYSKSFDSITIMKPNLSELVQMVSFALQQNLINSGKTIVSQIVSTIVSNRISSSKIDEVQLDIQDIRTLATALYRVMNLNQETNSRTGIISGKHLIVSLGSRGLLWCAGEQHLPKDKITSFGDRLVRLPDEVNPSFTLLVKDEALSPNDIVHTNGAGDAFCAGFLGDIAVQVIEHEVDPKDDHIRLLPNYQCIRSGLLASSTWLTTPQRLI